MLKAFVTTQILWYIKKFECIVTPNP